MPSHDTIVSYAIHPAIGIARVGNSQNDYFLAPQVPGEVPEPPYKDSAGAVKRQAAKFRIYGLNDQGQAVKEITADDADIEWRVHLANRKAGWYQFNNAMDLGSHAKESEFRNSSISGEDRRQLIIDPGARNISGRNQSGPIFDTGEFMTIKVYLGELRTDEHGRLLVLGGRGHSAPGGNTSTPATTFANNDGWYDDVSDGPVRATVRIGGKEWEAEPAMVVIAPPNFGQGLYSVVTMYDVVVDLFLRELQWLPSPERVSFWRDIYPIFYRLVHCQWVNQGVYFLFGKNSPSDLTSPELLAKLSDPAAENKKERQRLFNWFLSPDAAMAEPVKLPPFYGDEFGDFSGLVGDGLAVTRTQYRLLQQWANGDFYNNLTERTVSLRPLDQLPLAEQPHALDRAALEECLGGPFHPGIEMTWVMRRASMWKAPFRLKIVPENEQVKDDYGTILRPEVCLGTEGPLQASGPGTLTRWMGVPWQTDEASCLAGYDTSTYLPLPSFWAVRVPNDVLSERAYTRMLDERLPHAQRLKHFDHRQFWLRDLGVSYQQRINDMVASWDKVGIIAALPGPKDHVESDLPERIWAETQRSQRFSEHDPTWQQVRIAERQIQAPEEEQVRLAMVELAAEKPSTPLYQRRRPYRRGER